MTLLHSLWQAGLLALLYATATTTLLQKTPAATKRNLLLLQISLQLGLSVITFLLYYLQPTSQWQGDFQYYTELGSSIKPYFYNAAPWLIGLYFFWLGGKIFNLAYAWRQFAALHKKGLQKPTIDQKLFTKITADHMGIKKPVQLWLSHNIHTPITFGHLKPIILLPVALVNQISLQQTETLIIHELTHIKVNDYLFNWLLAIAETIFFFNPFVRYLATQTKLEREKYCDTNVLNFGKPPLLYAETLLLAAKLQQENIRWQMAAVSSKKQLLQRILFFTGPTPYQTHRSRAGIALIPLLLALMFFITTALLAVLPNTGKPADATHAAATALYVSPFTADLPSKRIVARNNEQPIAIKQPAPSLRHDKAAIATKKSAAIAHNNIRDINGKANEMIKPVLVYPEGLQTVSFNDATMVRDVFVEEDMPGTGVKTIKIYTLRLKDGNWVLEPKWMATSRTISVDTALLRLDSLQIRRISLQ